MGWAIGIAFIINCCRGGRILLFRQGARQYSYMVASGIPMKAALGLINHAQTKITGCPSSSAR